MVNSYENFFGDGDNMRSLDVSAPSGNPEGYSFTPHKNATKTHNEKKEDLKNGLKKPSDTKKPKN